MPWLGPRCHRDEQSEVAISTAVRTGGEVASLRSQCQRGMHTSAARCADISTRLAGGVDLVDRGRNDSMECTRPLRGVPTYHRGLLAASICRIATAMTAWNAHDRGAVCRHIIAA